jgi:hypothetical protein
VISSPLGMLHTDLLETNFTKFKTRIPILILGVALLQVAVAVPVPQDEQGKPETSAAKKPVEKKAKISVHIVVSAQGKDTLPSGSKIDLLGDEPTCEDVQRLQHSIGPDGATFPDLPRCKVKITIYITGFDTKPAFVDLADYKDPMRILVKSNGTPVISW